MMWILMRSWNVIALTLTPYIQVPQILCNYTDFHAILIHIVLSFSVVQRPHQCHQPFDSASHVWSRPQVPHTPSAYLHHIGWSTGSSVWYVSIKKTHFPWEWAPQHNKTCKKHWIRVSVIVSWHFCRKCITNGIFLKFRKLIWESKIIDSKQNNQ